MRQVTTYLLLIFLLVLNNSCTKQEAPVVNSDRFRSRDELERSKACEKVNFLKNFMKRDNLLSLFKCTGWQKQFPDLYSSLESIKKESWDHVMGPVGKEFFDDRVRRNRIFKKIQNLDAENGLDDLADVITALNETNFYDAINRMFECADNPGSEQCQKRKEDLLSKEEVMDLISMININPNLYGYMAKATRTFIKAVGENGEKLKEDIKKFYLQKSFSSLRLRLVDYFAGRILEGITEEDRLFVSKLLFTKMKGSKLYWLEDWIKNKNFSAEDFNNLMSYATIQNENLIKDIKVVKKGFNEGISCEYEAQGTQIVLNEREHVGKFLNDLSGKGFADFNKQLLQHAILIVSAEPYCPVIKSFTQKIIYIDREEVVEADHSISFKKMIHDMQDLLSSKPRYRLAQILANSSKFTEGETPFYLMELMSGVILQSINELNKVIIRNSTEYYKTLAQILKRVDGSIYPTLGAISLITMEEEYSRSWKGVAKFWHFLSEDEKGFLFRFIDKHLEDDTNYLLLFDFYAQILEEFPEVVSTISDNLAGDRKNTEKTYNALRDIAFHFAGKKTLKDFSLFFSRDHIIKTIKIISRGVIVDTPEVSLFDEQYSDSYVERIRKSPFEFAISNFNVSADHITHCVKALTESESNFYVMARRLPKVCKEVENHEIAVRFFSWLNYITDIYDNDYSDNSAITAEASLVDDKGFFSPAALKASIAMISRIDETFGNNKKQSGGVDYVLDSLTDILYKDENPVSETSGYYSTLENGLKVIDSFNEMSDEGSSYRASMIKKLTKDFNFKSTGDYFDYLSSFIIEYGHWFNQNGEVGSVYDQAEQQPEKYKCQNFHNKNIGVNPCPGNQRIKEGVDRIIKLMSRTNDKETPTAIGLLLQAAMKDQGLYIPYDSDQQQAKRLSLWETFKMMWETTDKSNPVNKKSVQYLPEGVKPSKAEDDEYLRPMTTMERVEVTIRDINFDMNYLGANYHNAIARAEDYDKEVIKRKKLMKTCHKLRFCGKTFKKDEYRKAYNSLQSYDGLLDSNSVFGYGDYMRSLLQIVVGSSSKISRKSSLVNVSVGGARIDVPFVQTKKQMKKHNGFILSEVGDMAAFSNAGRVIQDRVGRSREELLQFIDSYEFKLVSDEILAGYNVKEAEQSGVNLLKTLMETKNSKGELFHHKAIDYLSSLSYPELRFVEKTVSNLLVILSHVGSPDLYYEQFKDLNEADGYVRKRYHKNDFFNFFKSMDKLLKNWPLFEKYLPNRVNGQPFKLIEFLKPVNNLLVFFKNGLSSGGRPSENIFYKLLNESFLMFEEVLFYKNELHSDGMSYFTAMVSLDQENSRLQNLIRSIYVYFDQLHKKRAGNGFIEFGENLRKLVRDKLISFKAYQDYLYHTTRKDLCFRSNGQCKDNVHYDEPAKLMSLALRPHPKEKRTNLEVGLQNLLIDHRISISEMLNDIMPYLEIKPVENP